MLLATSEEAECALPKQHIRDDLLPCPDDTPVEYYEVEQVLLHLIDFNVGLPTPAHFIEYFLRLSVSSIDLWTTSH